MNKTEYKVYFNLNYMGIVKCDENFFPYVPKREGLDPLVELHYGLFRLETSLKLLNLLERIVRRLNQGSIAVKPYLTINPNF